MSFRYLAGDGLNLLSRAASVAVSPAADSLFPASGLFDGRFSPPFKWGTADEDAYIRADLNLVPNGDGEGADFDDWTLTGTNAALEASASSPYAGTYSPRLYLTSGTDTAASAATSIQLRAGEAARIYHALIPTSGQTMTITVTCENTQRSLNGSGEWTTLGTALVTRTTASWGDAYVTFTAPPREELGDDWGTFTITVEITDSPAASLDGKFEVKVVPGWDFLAVFGHGSTKYFAPGFEYQALSTNDPLDAWSSGTTPTWARTVSGYDTSAEQCFPAADLVQPALYNYLSAVRYERWVTIYPTVSGGETPPAAQGFGEVVLGQSKTFERNPEYPVRARLPFKGQIRNTTRAGDEYAFNPSRYPARELSLTIQPRTASPEQLEQVRYLFHRATQGGRYPMIVCPTETDESAVFYGALADAIDLSRDGYAFSTVELSLREFPFPDLRILGM